MYKPTDGSYDGSAAEILTYWFEGRVCRKSTDEDCVKAVLGGKVQLVYISPESLINNPCFRNMLLSSTYKSNLCALVIDEAYCVKTWGDQFRVAFAKIGDMRSLIPSRVNVLALTATVTNKAYGLCVKDCQ